jgi:hypothetical protein
MLAKLERKDFPSRPAKRVGVGRIEVEGLSDFRRGFGFIGEFLSGEESSG